MSLHKNKSQGTKASGKLSTVKGLAAKGRGGDTILAHINPQEQAMLKAMGGSGTINPATGLKEFAPGTGTAAGMGGGRSRDGRGGRLGGKVGKSFGGTETGGNTFGKDFGGTVSSNQGAQDTVTERRNEPTLNDKTTPKSTIQSGIEPTPYSKDAAAKPGSAIGIAAENERAKDLENTPPRSALVAQDFGTTLHNAAKTALSHTSAAILGRVAASTFNALDKNPDIDVEFGGEIDTPNRKQGSGGPSPLIPQTLTASNVPTLAADTENEPVPTATQIRKAKRGSKFRV